MRTESGSRMGPVLGMLISVLAAVAAAGAEDFQEEKLGPVITPIFNPAHSKGELHFVYVTQQGPKFLVVLDTRTGPAYDDIMAGTPIFSPDGKRVAYAARNGEKWLVVLDGRPGRSATGLWRARRSSARTGSALPMMPGKERSGLSSSMAARAGVRWDHDGACLQSGREARRLRRHEGRQWLIVLDGQPGRSSTGS